MLPLSDKTKPKPAVRWLAGFCALTVWMLGLLAVSPELHAALHADADHADHTCAITLFSHGTAADAGNTCLVSAPALFVAELCPIQPARPVASVLHRFPPGRGPPYR